MDDRQCPHCGLDPVPGVEKAIPAPSGGGTAEEPPASGSSPAARRVKRPSKSGRHRYLTLKLIVGWSLLLALIILGARRMWWRPQPDRPASATTADATPVEDPAALREAGQSCAAVFSAFVASGTPEERGQFVLDPIGTAAKMSRFYSLNPSTNLDLHDLSFAGSAMLQLPGAKMLETCWKTKAGRQVDAAFRQENGEWRLDWDHFARFSDYPWSLFLAGSGPTEGEFRLLARERLAKERKEESSMSIVLYAPRFGIPGETGFQSPEFLVPRASRDGRLLAAAFEMAASGKRVFGSTLPSLDPDGMIRVRVKVRRTEVDMERRFEIKQVIACHWYSLDDPGVTPAEERPEETPPAGPAE